MATADPGLSRSFWSSSDGRRPRSLLTSSWTLTRRTWRKMRRKKLKLRHGSLLFREISAGCYLHNKQVHNVTTGCIKTKREGNMTTLTDVRRSQIPPAWRCADGPTGSPAAPPSPQPFPTSAGAELLDPLVVLLQVRGRHRLGDLPERRLKVLHGGGHVHLVPRDVADLLRRQALDPAPHGHQGGVPAQHRPVRSSFTRTHSHRWRHRSLSSLSTEWRFWGSGAGDH